MTTDTTGTSTTAALVVLGATDRLRRADRELLVLAGTLGETHVVVPDAPGDALLGELVQQAQLPRDAGEPTTAQHQRSARHRSLLSSVPAHRDATPPGTSTVLRKKPY